MNELDKLAIKYGTDKWGKHHYTPVYHDLFADKRNMVLNVLEIGIAEGAGLRMFSDYFPNAIVYGIDSDKDRVESINRANRVNGVIRGPIIAMYGDQSEPEKIFRQLSVSTGEFDLIVDDGSHVPEHQIDTCKVLLPLLSKGGVYIIEDVSDIKIDKPVRIFAHNLGMYVELKRVGKRHDDQLIIIQNNG